MNISVVLKLLGTGVMNTWNSRCTTSSHFRRGLPRISMNYWATTAAQGKRSWFLFLFIDQHKSERISYLFIQISSKQQQSVLHFIYSSRGPIKIKVELDPVLHFPYKNTTVFVTITVQKKLFPMKVSIMLKTTIKCKKAYFHVNVAQWLISMGFHINCLISKIKAYF